MSRYIPKHRRPTRTDRLLLWAKDRLTAFADWVAFTVLRRPVTAEAIARDFARHKDDAMYAALSVFSWGEEGDSGYSATEYTTAVNTLADVRLQTAGGRDFHIWDMEVQP